MKENVNSPLDLFFDQMRDLHSMELQIGGHLPELVVSAVHEDLRGLLARHSEETDRQLHALGEIFARQGIQSGNDKCKAIAGLVSGGISHLRAVGDPATKDLMIVAHSLRVERYEIAAYEFTSRIARQLGLSEEADILAGILGEEERTADGLLELEPVLFRIASRQNA